MNLETEIRKALDEKAYGVSVPDGLAESTLAAAEAVPHRQPMLTRWRSWREARRMALPVSGYPRWVLAPLAGAAALMLFGLGAFVTQNGPRPMAAKDAPSTEYYNYRVERDDAPNATGRTEGEAGDAVGGQVAGVVSSGDSSIDATDNSAAQFVGLTGNVDEDQVVRDILGEDAPQLVRSANIRVAVGNFEGAWRDANEIAADHDGAVIDSKTRQVNDEIAEGTIRIRVPSTQLEDVLAALRGLGTVAEMTTSGDDIAPQMASVEEQIGDAKADEKELKELEGNATTISERLDVQRRLEEKRKSIENLESKSAKLRDQVEMSIVSATIFQDEVAAGRGAGLLGRGFETAGRVFLTIASGLLVLGAALLPLALVAALIWFLARRFNRKRS